MLLGCLAILFSIANVASTAPHSLSPHKLDKLDHLSIPAGLLSNFNPWNHHPNPWSPWSAPWAKRGCGLHVQENTVTVSTPYGRVKGVQTCKANRFTLPYARPPTGDRRFANLVDVEPWNNV
jgi:hypothetical protein